jgi:hypothetical protein
MDDKEINDELERLRASSKEYADLIDKHLVNLKKMGKSDQVSAAETLKFIKATQDANKKFKKTYEQITKTIEDLNAEYKKGTKTAEDLEEELDYLRKQINNTSDQHKKSALIEAKSQLENANARNKATEIFKTSLGTLAGTAIAGASKAFFAGGKAALAGGDAMDAAAATMTAQVDQFNGGIQVGAGAMMDFGKAVAGAGGALGVAGVAVSALGAAAGTVSSALAELVKAGIGFMMTETRKLISNFQEMSSSGAVFAGGMMEMIHTSQRAGLTLEQFSKAVSANKDNLSKTGLSVGGASKRLADAMETGGRAAKEGMYALGMTAQDQADAYAQTMALMAGPSGQLKASNAEVAAQTAEYARSLKTIADITGQDAKARMEKLRQDNDTLAFNSYLNGLNEKERKKTVEAMALMSTEDQRAFREKQIYGQVISKDLAISRATNDGIRKAQDEQFELAKQNNLDQAGVIKSYQSNQKEILEQSNQLGKTLGRVQSGAGADAAKSINNQTQWANRFADAQKTATLIAERQNQGAQGGAGPEVSLVEKNQQFLADMEGLAANNLGLFASAVDETMKQVQESVKVLRDVSEGRMVDAIKDTIKGMDWKILAMSILPGVIASAIPLVLSHLGKTPGGSGLLDAAEDAAGAVSKKGGLLGKIGRAGKFLGRVAGKAALPLAAATSIYEGYQGATHAEENLGIASGRDATGGERAASAAGSIASGLTFGLLDEKKAGQSILGFFGGPHKTIGDTLQQGGGGLSDALKLVNFSGTQLGDEAHFKNLDQDVGTDFLKMISEYGKPVQVNTSYRSDEEQQKLYDEWVRGGKKGNPVGKPGASWHGKGRALDLNSQQVSELNSAGLLAKYGFNTLRGDPPHIEHRDDGGYFEGPTIVGERGPELVTGRGAVTSRVQTDDMASKMTELANLFKQIVGQNADMLNILKDHKDISRKLLSATA